MHVPSQGGTELTVYLYSGFKRASEQGSGADVKVGERES